LRTDRSCIEPKGRTGVYVCNCNGIREREVRAAIAAGARRPAEVFKSKGCTAKCAKCVCDMRELITETARDLEPLRYAAE
jgi:bacterioferritin-associated ferredoxin